MSLLSEKALKEYCCDYEVSHQGGINGRPYWNIHSTQFMFCPSFHFTAIPQCDKYMFTITDCNKNIHTFTADKTTASLAPVWKDIPEGYTELKVEALDENNNPWTLAGARTFYKCAPYGGPDNYPPKARSYSECALMAYRYVYNQPYIQHWLLHGTPDTEYDFNVYPSKTYSSVIKAMIRYAELEPAEAENAIKLAENVADFLISISFDENSPLKGLPPTYYIEFRKNQAKKLEDYNNESAVKRLGGLMTIYPAEAGLAYLALEKITGEKRFFEAAQRIAEYYKSHVQPNGSWYLFVSVDTGEPIQQNFCNSDLVMRFLNEMHLRTGEEIWHKLELGIYNYIIESCMKPYNWEGQFEDSDFSSNYSNLSHLPPNAMISYITNNMTDNENAIREAEALMRFTEDQFVIWENFAPRNNKLTDKHGPDISQWFSPAGLEQYGWYMPISSSTANVMNAFLNLYRIKNDELLLAKACTLADMITRMQNPETGMIPTHWMRNTCIEDGGNLWINCLIATAEAMFKIANMTENNN